MELRVLLSKLEYLGVNCQPIRDLMDKSKNDTGIVSYFNPILSALESIISSSALAPNSSPLPVEMLLRQLAKGLVDYKPAAVPSSAPAPAPSTSPELIEVLLDLKRDISELKNQNSGSGQQSATIPAQSSIGMSPVFINPLDEKELKGNVSIEEKSGSNISNKLERLKQLKRDK